MTFGFVPPPDGIFTPQWYNVVDHVNDDMTLPAALVKALAASAVYGPFANGMFLAGARLLRYGLMVRQDITRAVFGHMLLPKNPES